jgi:hypothetical protein
VSGGPDVLDFVARALAVRGALSERSPGGLEAVLPPEVAVRLGIGESASLASAPAPGVVFAGFGSEVLEKLLHEESAALRVASAMLGDPGGRAPQAASSFTLLNGPLESTGGDPGRSRLLLVAFPWKAECDELVEGLRMVAVSAPSGACWSGYPEQFLAGLDLTETEVGFGERGELERLMALAGERARRLVLAETREFIAAVIRRKGRDGERLRGYFADARTEMKGRRDRGGEAVLAAKLARLDQDEGAKLAELDERYRVRLRLRPAALIALDVPVRTARLRLRRRKAERELEVRYHPVVHAWEPLVCDGCGDETRAFAACDEAFHVLCRGCYGAEGRAGRRPCRRCQTRRAAGPQPLRVIERVVEATRSPPAASLPVPVLRKPEPPPATEPTRETGAEPEPGQLALPFDPELSVRSAISGDNGMTAIEAAAAAGLPVELVRPILRRLVSTGFAVTEGRTRATRYRRRAAVEAEGVKE